MQGIRLTRKQFDIQCLAQRLFDMWTGGAGDQISNLLLNRQAHMSHSYPICNVFCCKVYCPIFAQLAVQYMHIL